MDSLFDGVTSSIGLPDGFLQKLEQLLSKQQLTVVAIDGKCGSGKSTLAQALAQKYDATVLHMDDFYLPRSLRTKARLETPGGNVHYERFLTEVATPLMQAKTDGTPTTLQYRIFDCHTMDYSETVAIRPKSLVIVEGSYSMRPELRALYDTSLFLDIDSACQKERLLSRVGKEALIAFETRWIPMENRYFEYYKIKEICEFTKCVVP